MKSKRIAVDIGGTFVDAVEFDSKTSEIRFKKALTTPHRPAEGVFNALKSLDTQIEDVDKHWKKVKWITTQKQFEKKRRVFQSNIDRALLFLKNT